MRELGGIDQDCPCCKKRFRTYIQGTYGKICNECKDDFGVRNSVEAQELLDIIAGDGDDAAKTSNWESRRHQGTQFPRRVPVRDPVDNARVAEAMRAAIAYGVLTPLPESLPQPTTYALARNGLFEVRESDIARIVTQPKDVMGLVADLTPGVTLHVPKVPYAILEQTVAFFREVCTKSNGTSEAFVQIWWNRQDKAYHVHVPEQSVSGGSVNHRSEFDRENQRDEHGASIWLYVMDIHSHGTSMSAFWSGTDDGDERKAPEGRMFGVIGKVAQPLPEWRWRMRTREGFIDLKVSDVFEIRADNAIPFTVTWDVIMEATTAKDGLATDGRIRLLCPVDPFKDVTCPPEWHEKVKSHWGGGRASGMGFGRHWEGHSGHTLPMYIYVLDPKENVLQEYLVDGNSTSVLPKPTGKRVTLKPRDTNGVH